jgi:hypothetical protein
VPRSNLISPISAQEKSILREEGLPGGKVLIKTGSSDTTTVTPHVEFAPDLVKMLANVASLVKTEILLVSPLIIDAITNPDPVRLTGPEFR